MLFSETPGISVFSFGVTQGRNQWGAGGKLLPGHTKSGMKAKKWEGKKGEEERKRRKGREKRKKEGKRENRREKERKRKK